MQQFRRRGLKHGFPEIRHRLLRISTGQGDQAPRVEQVGMRTELVDGPVDQAAGLGRGVRPGEVERKVVGDDRRLRRLQPLPGQKILIDLLGFVLPPLEVAKLGEQQRQ